MVALFCKCLKQRQMAQARWGHFDARKVSNDLNLRNFLPAPVCFLPTCHPFSDLSAR